jgi:hypothetical protein
LRQRVFKQTCRDRSIFSLTGRVPSRPARKVLVHQPCQLHVDGGCAPRFAAHRLPHAASQHCPPVHHPCCVRRTRLSSLSSRLCVRSAGDTSANVHWPRRTVGSRRAGIAVQVSSSRRESASVAEILLLPVKQR